MKKHLSEGQKEIIRHALDGLVDIASAQPDSSFTSEELLHELFNSDYFIVGYYAAEQFLIRWGGVFKAIGEIIDYEKLHFGETITDLSSAEDVANVLAYIEGERFLHECPTWGQGRFTTDDLIAIKNELLEL